MMKPLHIILVDDNETFRKALKLLLNIEFNTPIIGEASNAKEFWEIPNFQNADLILMDVMIPGTDGITLTREVLWNYNSLKVLAMTMHFDKVYLTTLIEAGFVGCMFKNNLFNELKPALKAVTEGKLYFPNSISLSKNDLS